MLGRYLDEGRRRADRYAWAAPDKLHLTLRFLGNREPEQLQELERALARIDARAFQVRLGGLRTFGGRARPRVVWTPVTAGETQLTALAAQVEAACREAGIEPEERPFRAHLTLARARRDSGSLGELPPPPELAPFIASEIVLFQSTLGRGGSVYTPLASFALGAG